MYVCNMPGQKRIPWNKAVSCHAGAGSRTPVPWRVASDLCHWATSPDLVGFVCFLYISCDGWVPWCALEVRVVLSVHRLDPGHQTQVCWLGRKLFPAGPSHWPKADSSSHLLPRFSEGKKRWRVTSVRPFAQKLRMLVQSLWLSIWKSLCLVFGLWVDTR